MINPGRRLNGGGLWFGLLATPFFLNDFSNIFISGYKTWLAIDYIFVKFLPTVLIVYLLQTKKLHLDDLGLKMPTLPQLVGWTVLMAVIGIALDQVGWRFFEKVLPDTRLGGMPWIPVPWVGKFDLFFGLLCTGILEEGIIFRGLAFTYFRKSSRSTAFVFVATALVFGLVHWSLGIHAILNTAIVGAVFMVVMWRTGSVVPTIIAHFFVNYVAFSGMIPYDSPWFNFLK